MSERPAGPVVSPADTPAWYDKERVEALTAMIDDPDLADIEQRARRVLTGTQSGRYTKRMLARDVLALLAVGERDKAEREQDRQHIAQLTEALAGLQQAVSDYISGRYQLGSWQKVVDAEVIARAVLADEEDARTTKSGAADSGTVVLPERSTMRKEREERGRAAGEGDTRP